MNKSSKTGLNRKAQQEMVGFMIIIIIVAIVGVIFLVMYLRSPVENMRDDAELANFLISSSKITSNCMQGSAYRTLEELEEDCFTKRDCADERDSCVVLEESYKDLIGELWPVGVDRPIGQYKMSFYYRQFLEETEDDEGGYGQKQMMMQFEEGNSSSCISRRGATHSLNIGSGEIVSDLEICRNV